MPWGVWFWMNPVRYVYSSVLVALAKQSRLSTRSCATVLCMCIHQNNNLIEIIHGAVKFYLQSMLFYCNVYPLDRCLATGVVPRSQKLPSDFQYARSKNLQWSLESEMRCMYYRYKWICRGGGFVSWMTNKENSSIRYAQSGFLWCLTRPSE